MNGVDPRNCFVVLYAEWEEGGFNRGSPKASCDPVGHSLTAGRAVVPGAKPSDHAAGHEATRTFVAADTTFREKPPQRVCVVFLWLAQAPPCAPSRRKRASLPWPLIFRLVVFSQVTVKVSVMCPIEPKKPYPVGFESRWSVRVRKRLLFAKPRRNSEIGQIPELRALNWSDHQNV